MITLSSSVVVLSLYSFGLHPVAFIARLPECGALPVNIQARDDLRSVIAGLIARSATIRSQCARIAASRLTRVNVTLTLEPMDPGARARSIARRYQSGILLVSIQIPPASRDFAELLAHELEHVTELIDGVDFKRLAAAGGSKVIRRPSDGSFESERARQAGITAAAEVARRGTRQ